MFHATSPPLKYFNSTLLILLTVLGSVHSLSTRWLRSVYSSTADQNQGVWDAFLDRTRGLRAYNVTEEVKMKDEEVKKATQSDDEGKAAENGELVRMDGDDSHAAIVNSNGKSRNKANRKRRGSTSPEEDIIDGFAISSYSSLEALEVGRNNNYLRPSLSNY